MYTAQERKTLQLVIKTAQIISGARLLSIRDINEVRFLWRAQRIFKDKTHPIYSLFMMLIDKRYRDICCHTSRLKDRFYPQDEFLSLSSHSHVYCSFYFY